MSTTVDFNSTAQWDSNTRVVFYDWNTDKVVDTDGSLVDDSDSARNAAAVTPSGDPGSAEFPADAAMGLYYAYAYTGPTLTTDDEPFFGWGWEAGMWWDGASLGNANGALIASFIQALAQSRPIIINSPITATEMTLVQGDEYKVSEETEITLTKQSGELGWPASIDTIHFSCAPNDVLTKEQAYAEGIDDVALTSVTASGGSLSLTATQTSGLVTTPKSGRYRFRFVANKGTYPKTIRTGSLTVVEGDAN